MKWGFFCSYQYTKITFPEKHFFVRNRNILYKYVNNKYEICGKVTNLRVKGPFTLNESEISLIFAAIFEQYIKYSKKLSGSDVAFAQCKRTSY